MNARMLIPSKYFTAAAFEGEAVVTIESVSFTDVEVEGKNGKPPTSETKGSLMLKEFPGKPWLCNVTNTKCLIAMFGEEDAEKRWLGKRVAVHQERVMSFGEWVPGVRIHGSPDITAPVSVSLKLRKKKAQVLTMQPTARTVAAPQNGNGHAKPPITTVTFGEKQGWKDKPIASFDSATLNKIYEEGLSWVVRTENASPNEPWLPGVRACLKAIEADLQRRVAPPDPTPTETHSTPPPF